MVEIELDALRPLNSVSEQLPRRRKHIALLRRRHLASWPNGTQSTGQIWGDDLNNSLSFLRRHLRQQARLRRCRELQPDIVKRRWKANRQCHRSDDDVLQACVSSKLRQAI